MSQGVHISSSSAQTQQSEHAPRLGVHPDEKDEKVQRLPVPFLFGCVHVSVVAPLFRLRTIYSGRRHVVGSFFFRGKLFERKKISWCGFLL